MKNIISKILCTLLIISSVLTFNIANAGAVNVFKACSGSSNGSTVCNDATSSHTDNPIILIIKSAIEVISYVAGAAAIVLIAVSAVRFITSGGDPNNVASAKNTLIYAIVGLVITILAQIIVLIILRRV